MTTETVNCPICNDAGAVKVRNAADIVRCNGCGIVYLRTRPTVSELEKLYATYASTPGSHMKLPQTMQELKTTGLRRNYMMSDIIAYTGSRRGGFLDVGSGWGAFLLNAREHDFLSVEGVEICDEMAEFATNILGIRTWKRQLEDCDLKDEDFQVVSLLHSFEHLPYPSRALSCIHRILEPGGLICGIVPNFDSWASNTHKDAWKWLDPVVHYVHYTPDTLKKTLWNFGFAMQKMYTETGDYDRKQLPQPAVLKRIEAEGHGEEIRFFATKL